MQPELEQLAREAGLGQFTGNDRCELGPQLERFAMLVAQAENERCAAICDSFDTDDNRGSNWADNCAAAIRSSAPRANGGEHVHE